MASSPIRKLTPLADAAKARGIKVYHLNIGQPDIPSPKKGLEALKNIDRTILEYSPSQGFLSLRRKISEYYARCGMDFGPEQITVTSGASEAVLFSFLSCMDPGDELITTEPTYANYLAFADGNLRADESRVELLSPCASRKAVSACKYGFCSIGGESILRYGCYHIVFFAVPHSEIIRLEVLYKFVRCIARYKVKRAHTAGLYLDVCSEDVVFASGELIYDDGFSVFSFFYKRVFFFNKIFS